MIWLANGASVLYQWERGVTVNCDNPCDVLSVWREDDKKAKRIVPAEVQGVYRIEIPRQLLQQSGYLRIEAIDAADDGERVIDTARIIIRPRKKPDDYPANGGEAEYWQSLNLRMNAIERKAREGDFNGEKGDPGVTPHVGANGNWYLGDTDTGVHASGVKGAPYIGENGNWWFNGVDSGVQAKGEKGDPGNDGLTPYIGDDGNWHIGETNTHVTAQTYLVGDIKETMRTDLGEEWVLCNGDAVHEDAYPELYGVLPYNTGWRRVPVNGIQIRPLPKDGEWEIILSEYSPYNPSSSGQKIGLYNSNTETYIEIAKPVLNTTIGYGIFGITHDGDRYILGVVEDENDTVAGVIHLFASTDLETWAECYSFECKSSGYVPYQLTFDGLNIVCIEKYYSTSYAHRIVAIDKAMTKTTVLLSSGSNETPYYLRQLPSGYWSYGAKDANTISVYPAGERKSPLFTLDRYLTSDAYAASAAFFNEKFWITLPKSGGSTSYVLVTNLETNGGLHIPIGNIIDIGVDVYYYNGFYGAVYDRTTDEWLLYVKFSLTNNASDIKYYVIYVPQTFDWTAPTKCRYEEIASIPKDLTNEQMALDKSRIRTVSTSEVYISNPNIKFLPTHDGETYKYIYAGGAGE